MKTEDIEYRLKAMRLPRMRDEYERQRNDPEFQHMSFDERFAQMVSLEYDARINNTIETLIRKADFYDSTASLTDVNYKPERKLNQGLIEELGTNEHIRNHLNIILIGASGCGKTWLSNAFGINACQARIKTKYIRLPELFSEFEAKRIQGMFRQYLKQLQKYDLLILDEPTSVLDPYNRRIVLNTIRSMKGTRLVASHDLDLILDVCDRVILIDRGRVIADGQTEQILRNRELLEAHRLELPLRYQ